MYTLNIELQLEKDLVYCVQLINKTTRLSQTNRTIKIIDRNALEAIMLQKYELSGIR